MGQKLLQLLLANQIADSHLIFHVTLPRFAADAAFFLPLLPCFLTPKSAGVLKIEKPKKIHRKNFFTLCKLYTFVPEV
jgi:hypothetical protein